MVKFKPYFDRRYPWRERLIAILALINLGLVFFDLSYLFGRSFYLHIIPGLTRLYDPIKGIKPHPETEYYLETVDALETQIATTGLQSQEVENLLAQLRAISRNTIEQNPFAGANKSSTLETIKNYIRVRTGESLASNAFARFWSSAYLQETGWRQEMVFWNNRIRPLIQNNYYRGVSKYGTYIDYFWLLDLPFVLIFLWDTLARILTIHHRHPNLNWLESVMRRWYDLLLLLPFLRWLRVIPTSIRLYHADLLNLESVRAEVQRDLVISFATELTEMIGIQVIDQMQASVRRGDFIRWLLDPTPPQPYVEVNSKNEVKEIASRLFNIGIYDVIPKVQPDIEDLVHHSIASTLTQLPGYKHLQHIPGLSRVGRQINKNLAKGSFQIAYNSLTNTLQDPVAAAITTRLRKNFRDALEKEVMQKHNIEEIQSLLVDMLEEIKLNYVKGIVEAGGEQLVEKIEQLHKQIRQ